MGTSLAIVSARPLLATTKYAGQGRRFRTRCRRVSYVLEVLAQPLQRLQLGHRLATVGQHAYGLFLGLHRRQLVDVLGADGGVGKNGDDLRLHL
jgi:hypothetical protein